MEQLKVHVERVVRPIRGEVSRKNKMRDELLAHLTQKAEALVAAGADEPAACDEAIQQLGDPAALRADLQATVPLLERVAYWTMPDFGFFDTYFEKADRESSFHFALVRTGLIAVIVSVILVIMITVRWLGVLPGRHRVVVEPDYCVLMLSFSYVWTVISNFICYYLIDVTGMRRLMSKATPCPAWVKGGTLCLFMCANVLLMIAPIMLFAWIINPADAVIMRDAFRDVFVREFGLGILVAAFVLFIIASAAMKFEHKQWVKWGSLRIDE